MRAKGATKFWVIFPLSCENLHIWIDLNSHLDWLWASCQTLQPWSYPILCHKIEELKKTRKLNSLEKVGTIYILNLHSRNTFCKHQYGSMIWPNQMMLHCTVTFFLFVHPLISFYTFLIKGASHFWSVSKNTFMMMNGHLCLRLRVVKC